MKNLNNSLGEEDEEDYVVREIDVSSTTDVPPPDKNNDNNNTSMDNDGQNSTTMNGTNTRTEQPNSSMKDRDVYIVQFPTKPFFDMLTSEEISDEIWKKILIGLHVNQDGDHFNTDAETFLMVDTCQMRSSFVDTTNTQMTMTPYAIGALQEDELHLNPVKGIFQMRPVLDHVDAGPEAILRDSNGNEIM